MHFSFWEKTGFALLIAAWVTWGTNQLGDMLVHADNLEENAFKIEVADTGSAGASKEAAVAEPSALELLASVSADDGAKVFRKCAGCHNAENGAANKVGPNLYNTMGSQLAHHDGFAYSDALKGKGGEWTYEAMDAFLENPKGFVPGTKMTFAGLKKSSDRAKVILYLRQQSDNPIPLP